MGTKLNCIVKHRDGSYSYNGYTYRPGERNEFSLNQLVAIRDADMQTERECTPAFLAELDYAKEDEGVLTGLLAERVTRTEYIADYRKKNREQINQTKREWRKANPELSRAESRANYRKHKAARADYQRAYRARKRAERITNNAAE